MLTFLLGWLTHPVSLAIGWTLLHFLWQGAAVWLVAALCARGLRRASAARRYGVWLLLFTMLPVLPLATFLVLSPAIDPEPIPLAAEDTASASTPQLGIDFSITENEQGVLGARPVFILSESQESPAEEPPPLPSAALVSFQVEHPFLDWMAAAEPGWAAQRRVS